MHHQRQLAMGIDRGIRNRRQRLLMKAGERRPGPCHLERIEARIERQGVREERPGAIRLTERQPRSSRRGRGAWRPRPERERPRHHRVGFAARPAARSAHASRVVAVDILADGELASARSTARLGRGRDWRGRARASGRRRWPLRPPAWRSPRRWRSRRRQLRVAGRRRSVYRSPRRARKSGCGTMAIAALSSRIASSRSPSAAATRARPEWARNEPRIRGQRGRVGLPAPARSPVEISTSASWY